MVVQGQDGRLYAQGQDGRWYIVAPRKSGSIVGKIVKRAIVFTAVSAVAGPAVAAAVDVGSSLISGDPL